MKAMDQLTASMKFWSKTTIKLFANFNGTLKRTFFILKEAKYITLDFLTSTATFLLGPDPCIIEQ